MVRCNLSVLLAEQNLKITKVAKNTGLSRTTLTSLANNYSQGFQFDTLNTLCMYLKVSPEQLISFIPVDIYIEYVHIDSDNRLNILMNLTKHSQTVQCSLTGTVKTFFDGGVLEAIDICIELWDANGDVDIERENLLITDVFQQLNRSFLTDIQNEIVASLIQEFEYVKDPYDLSFTWDKELLS